MAQNRIPRHWPIILAILVLTYLVAVVFYPILGFSFITLDVNEQVLDNPRALGYLGDALRELGQTDRAAEFYRKSVRIDPDCVGVLNNFAICLTSDRAPRLDDHRLAVELAERGCRLTEWQDPDLTRTLARSHTSLANTYHAAGRFDLAIDHYELAIRAHPEYDMAFFNLAVLLSTCRDKGLRAPDRAVRLAEQGCRLVGSPDAHRLDILATAYAAAGRFDDAVAVTQEAIEAALAAGDPNQLTQLRRHLHRFENRLPLTEP